MEGYKILRELQNGLWSGRRLDDSLFALTQCLEITKTENRPLCLASLGISGAHDNVNRELLWGILKDEGIGHELIELLKEIYRANTFKLLGKE